jgi:hypothetical protein
LLRVYSTAPKQRKNKRDDGDGTVRFRQHEMPR